MGGEGCRRRVNSGHQGMETDKMRNKAKTLVFQKKQFGINCGTTVENIYFALPM
jgi:hypothetical protein